MVEAAIEVAGGSKDWFGEGLNRPERTAGAEQESVGAGPGASQSAVEEPIAQLEKVSNWQKKKKANHFGNNYTYQLKG